MAMGLDEHLTKGREDPEDYDFSRVTYIGWLVCLLTITVGIGCGIGVDVWSETTYPPPPGKDPSKGWGGLAGVAAAVGFFFTARFILQVVGMPIIRPVINKDILSDSVQVVHLRMRLHKTRRWRLVFLWMMPMGVMLPCVAAYATSRQNIAGLNTVDLLFLTAAILPVIGLMGTILLSSDLSKFNRQLKEVMATEFMAMYHNSVDPETPEKENRSTGMNDHYRPG
jgi:hypothetical protein